MSSLVVGVGGFVGAALRYVASSRTTTRTNLRLFLATGNVGVTLVACFIAGLLGIALARLVVPE